MAYEIEFFYFILNPCQNLQFKMDLECIVCNLAFIPELFPPFSACPRRHIACICCYSSLFKHNQEERCPECRTPIEKGAITIFKPYQLCDLYLESSKRTQAKQNRQLRQQRVDVISKLISFAVEVQETELRKFTRQISITLIKQKDFASAQLLLRQLIELFPSPEQNEKFIGIGMKVETIGYCEIQYSHWQRKCFGLNVCLEDLLQMCYLRQDIDHEQKKSWYLRMHNKFPSNQRILFGLAVTLLNGEQLQLSLAIFDRIIKSKHPIIKANQCKILIQGYLRFQDKNEKILFNQLKINLNESAKLFKQIHALFMKGVAESNSFKRIWIFQKCIELNANYVSPQLFLAFQRCSQGYLEVAGHIFMNIIRNQRASSLQQSLCYQGIGMLYFKCHQYEMALHFLDKSFPNAGSCKPRILVAKIRALSCLKRYDQTKMIGNQAIIYLRKRIKDTNSPKINIRFKENIGKIYQIIMKIYFQQNQNQKAIDLLKQWKEFNSESQCRLYNKIINERITFLERKQNEKECFQWFICCIQKNYMVEFASKKVIIILQSRGSFQIALQRSIQKKN